MKGHFLSAANVCPLNVSETTNKLTNVSAVDRLRGGLEAKTNILVPPLLLGGDLLARRLRAKSVPKAEKTIRTLKRNR